MDGGCVCVEEETRRNKNERRMEEAYGRSMEDEAWRKKYGGSIEKEVWISMEKEVWRKGYGRRNTEEEV